MFFGFLLWYELEFIALHRLVAYFEQFRRVGKPLLLEQRLDHVACSTANGQNHLVRFASAKQIQLLEFLNHFMPRTKSWHVLK